MKTLIIEDDIYLIGLIKENIEACGFQTVAIHSAEEAIQWLTANTPRLMVLDYRLPDMDGKEFISELKKLLPDIPPFIVSTGQGDERIAVDMMKLGARDYIIKDHYFLERLPEVVKRVNREIESETKRKQAEERLQKSETTRVKMVANIGDVIVIIDKDGINRYKSPNIEKWFGWKQEELVGVSIWNNVHPDNLESAQKFFDSLMGEPDAAKTTEFQYLCKDGSYKWIEITVANLLHDPDIHGYLGNYHDISTRKTAEKEIKLKNEQLITLNAEKDRLFSIIAHDLRGPFQGILGFSDTLTWESESLSKEDVCEYNKELNNALKKQYELLDDLLNWSRIQLKSFKLKLEDFVLATKVEMVIERLNINASQKQISIINNIAWHLIISGDSKLMDSVFRNLIANAIKFANPKGRIEISAVRKDEFFIEISVADNGIGISEEVLAKLFRIDVIYSTPGTDNEAGTGLGLILCDEIIKSHNGKIRVESQVGIGSTFSFTFPCPESKS
ncbi:MAG: ATP-binding protein [Ignavibacteria bacterium]